MVVCMASNDMLSLTGTDLMSIDIRADNGVSITWSLYEDGPEYASYGHPAEWSDDHYGSTKTKSDEEIETLIEEAKDETKPVVMDLFYTEGADDW